MAAFSPILRVIFLSDRVSEAAGNDNTQDLKEEIHADTKKTHSFFSIFENGILCMFHPYQVITLY